jgi:hypothetical protein
VENENWQSDERKLLLEPLVGAREVLVLETQHVGMRRDVAQALEDGEGESAPAPLTSYLSSYRWMIPRLTLRHDRLQGRIISIRL